MLTDRALRKLTLFAALAAAFDQLHPLGDHWAQGSRDAKCKELHGTYLVYEDGTPVAEAPVERAGEPTWTASQLGRLCALRHVASYSAVQLSGTVALTRVLGYRIPAGALLAGAAVNASTHLVIDRRRSLMYLAKLAGKRGYIDRCHAVRLTDDGPRSELSGPGSALMELDAALHRAIGLGAAALTAWLAVRE